MEFHDELDNFEVIAKRLTCQEPYCGEWDSEEEFSPIRSKLLRGRPAHRRGMLRPRKVYGRPRPLLRLRSVLAKQATSSITDASCLCTTTRWAPTITCSATSDPNPPSLHQGLHFCYLNFTSLQNFLMRSPYLFISELLIILASSERRVKLPSLFLDHI